MNLVIQCNTQQCNSTDYFFFYLSNVILNQCDIISGKYRKYWCKLNWTTECRHGKSWHTRWKCLTVCLISPPPTKQLNASTAAQLNTTIKCIIQPTAWVEDFLCPSVLSNNVLWQAPSWNQTRKMAKTNALSLTWLGWRAVTVFCFFSAHWLSAGFRLSVLAHLTSLIPSAH